ncbi:MAG: LytTR family DNA-binding domain-containing protein [Bacteroidota bacterium]
MNIVIIEDEKLAREKLQGLIKRYDEGIQVVANLDSVDSALCWLSENEAPDLIFVDIHLADGISFEIFEKIDVSVPVIFTTAYDQYAIKAFRLNSVDYLLKPIQFEDLERSFDKFKKLNNNSQSLDIGLLREALSIPQQQYKSRFITKVGENIQSINISDVSYFFTEFKGVFLMTWEAKKHLINYTLEQLENVLDPNQFFRLNRKYIVDVEAIEKMSSYHGGRLKVCLKDCSDDEIIVSREKVAELKKWLDR